jgi:hypothetical protein
MIAKDFCNVIDTELGRLLDKYKDDACLGVI